MKEWTQSQIELNEIRLLQSFNPFDAKNDGILDDYLKIGKKVTYNHQISSKMAHCCKVLA
jgi:hypothetical protein